MWILVMLVLSNAGLSVSNNIYYEDECSCLRAAAQFEEHRSKDFKLKAFCIRGE